MIRTKWLKQIKHLLTIVSNQGGKSNWLEKKVENTRLSVPETLVSWLISMQVRQLLQNVSFIIQVSTTKSVILMKVPQQWTGWSRSRREGSQLLPLLQHVTGLCRITARRNQVLWNIVSTSLILQDT